MEKYNTDKLIKVKVYDKSINQWTKFKKEFKIFGFTYKKEGFYGTIYKEYQGANVPRDCELIDGVLYKNPRVVLYYENDFSTVYFFKTYKKAVEFADSLTKDFKWIT